LNHTKRKGPWPERGLGKKRTKGKAPLVLSKGPSPEPVSVTAVILYYELKKKKNKKKMVCLKSKKERAKRQKCTTFFGLEIGGSKKDVSCGGRGVLAKGSGTQRRQGEGGGTKETGTSETIQGFQTSSTHPEIKEGKKERELAIAL